MGGGREGGEGGLGVGVAAKMMDYNSITPPVKMMAELRVSSQRHLSLYKTASKSSMQQQSQLPQPSSSASGVGGAIGGSSGVTRQGSNNHLVATGAGKVGGGGVGVSEKGSKAVPGGGGGAGLGGSKSGGSGAGQSSGDGNETTSIAKKKGIIHPYSLKRKIWDFISKCGVLLFRGRVGVCGRKEGRGREKMWVASLFPRNLPLGIPLALLIRMLSSRTSHSLGESIFYTTCTSFLISPSLFLPSSLLSQFSLSWSTTPS